ncbi:glycosyltransferase family 1 protein, partial [Salmonella enterica subsp. diarizonae]|nr:glycosyltransferase family 1 protein [Salmonella enterica subsp. diarizonae]
GYNDSFLKKDVGMVPLCMSNGELVDTLFYCKDKKGTITFDKLNIEFTGCGWLASNFKSILFLLRNIINGRGYDLLVFHLSIRNIIPILIFKSIFKGKLICKMDLNTESAIKYATCHLQSQTIKYKLMKMMVGLTDIFYIETRRNYDIIKKGIFGLNISEKLKIMPNGVDENLVKVVSQNGGITPRKEKILTIISRFNCEAKAPYRIFDVIEIMSELNISEWTLNIIGKFPESFITDLRKKAVCHNVNIVCEGYNLELKDVYKHLYKSKVFLCLSIEESYCISLVESAVFNNCIITTNVGVSADLSQKYDRIKILDTYTKEKLKFYIREVIMSEQTEYCDISLKMLELYSWKKIINKTVSD